MQPEDNLAGLRPKRTDTLLKSLKESFTQHVQFSKKLSFLNLQCMFQVLESRNEGKVHKLNPEKYLYNERQDNGRVATEPVKLNLDPITQTVKESFDKMNDQIDDLGKTRGKIEK